MNLKTRFGEALRKIRIISGYAQEDFSRISSRTYISSLERGLYSPTLEKLDEIAAVIGIHPLTLLAQTYLGGDADTSAHVLLSRVEKELKEIDKYTSNGGSSSG